MGLISRAKSAVKKVASKITGKPAPSVAKPQTNILGLNPNAFKVPQKTTPTKSFNLAGINTAAFTPPTASKTTAKPTAKTTLPSGNLSKNSFKDFAAKPGASLMGLGSQAQDQLSGLDLPTTTAGDLTQKPAVNMSDLQEGVRTGGLKVDQGTALNPKDTTVSGAPEVAPTTGAPTDTTSQYRAAATQGAPNGVDLENAGAATGAVQGALKDAAGTPPPPGGQQIMDIFSAGEDPAMDAIQKAYSDFYNPKNQTMSLMDTYNKLTKDSGLAELNADLINYKNIINGTEDDIRTEITKAGGFATESQVAAMTNSRNKSLIANYNNLLETKEAINEQINTMMGFAQQDRTYAQQQFEGRMGFEIKKVEMGRQAQQFATTQLNNIASKVGYAGLLAMTGGDPYATARAEKALGMSAGGLQQLAALPDPDAEEKALDLEYKRAQIRNINSQISERGAKDAVVGSPDNARTQIDLFKASLEKAKGLASASGTAGWKIAIGDRLVGDTSFRRLENVTDTLRTNVLSLATDPNVKKFFGPQMTEADVRLMTAGGTTLNPKSQSPDDMLEEIKRLEGLASRIDSAMPSGSATQSSVIPQSQIPTGYYQASDGKFYKK